MQPSSLLIKELPMGWQRQPLAALSRLIKDGTHGTHPRVSSGVPLLSAKNISEGGNVFWDEGDSRISETEYAAIHRTYELLPDDLLITVVGSLGRRALVPSGYRFSIQRSVALIRADLRQLYPRYLFHFVGTDYFQRQLVLRSNATAQAGVYLGELATIEVTCPPVPEQRRIAAILDTVDDAIQQTEALIAKRKWVRTGLMHDLLTYGLDEHGQLRDPSMHPEQFRDTQVGLVPRDWAFVRLLDHLSLPSGQLDPKLEPYRSWPLIAPDHIEPGTGRLLALETAAEQGAISGKYPFQAGDVVYSKIRPYLRKAVLANQEGLCSADMYPLRPGPRLVPRFLLALVLGEHFSRFAEAVSMRSGFPKINREELAEYHVSLPCCEEQQRIAAVLDAEDRRSLAEEAYRDKLKQLKQGLMDDLLTGRVRLDEASTMMG